MQLFALNYRECDGQGCGHYGASRGARTHKGVDMACVPGTEVASPVTGQVTKLGWPYADKPAVRYVEITAEGYRFRLFYVSPSVKEGEFVQLGQTVGRSQKLESMERGGTQHVHFEIMNEGGGYVDPTPVVVALRGTLRDAPVE